VDLQLVLNGPGVGAFAASGKPKFFFRCKIDFEATRSWWRIRLTLSCPYPGCRNSFSRMRLKMHLAQFRAQLTSKDSRCSPLFAAMSPKNVSTKDCRITQNTSDPSLGDKVSVAGNNPSAVSGPAQMPFVSTSHTFDNFEVM